MNLPRRRIVLLTYDGMNLLDLAGPLQAFATAGRKADGIGFYETLVASVDGGLVATSSGLAVNTVSLASLKGVAIDTLMAAGGCRGQEYHAPQQLVQWIRKRAPSVRRLCSVCTGAFLLAAAGQLDGRRAATHWDWVGRLKSRHPKIQVDPNRLFVQDGPVWTSAGVTAGIDLTLALIEEDFGHRVAIETARQLVMFIKRAGGQSQFSVPLEAQAVDPGTFADLHAWVAGNLTSDLCVEQLAEQVGMSPRTFARAYVAKCGRTPAKMVEAMRLEAACRALEETNLPLKAIAEASGYPEEQNLRRVFLRKLGTTPAQYRGRFSSHERKSPRLRKVSK
jgi:transcriptional regulator GlxA family with amidase domain